MSSGKRWGIRTNAGRRELIWIEVVRNGFWRGIRVADGGRSRGPVSALVGRYDTEQEARAVLAAFA